VQNDDHILLLCLLYLGDSLVLLLQQLQLVDLLPTFKKEMIDYDVLITLKEDELKELGIPMGARKKILQSEQNCSENELIFVVCCC
jgi:hypothetical protein